MKGDAFLQHWCGHSTSTYIAHVEGFFAEWTKEPGPVLLQNGEVENDQLIWVIQGTCACDVQLNPDTTLTYFQDDLGQKAANVKEGKPVGVTI